MKLTHNQIIKLPITTMRDCRTKIMTLLRNELAISENSLNTIITSNKVIFIRLKEGYFPLKCRLTLDELECINLRLVSLDTIEGSGYIIIKDLNHISLDFLQNQLLTIN